MVKGSGSGFSVRLQFGVALLGPFLLVFGLDMMGLPAPQHSRLFGYFSPALMILAGVGLASTRRKIKTLNTSSLWLRQSIVIGFLILGGVPSLSSQYRNEIDWEWDTKSWHGAKHEYSEPAFYVTEHAAPGSMILHTARATLIPFASYYLPAYEHQFVASTESMLRNERNADPTQLEWVEDFLPGTYVQPLDAFIADRDEVWVIFGYWMHSTHIHFLEGTVNAKAYLDQWGERVEYRRFDDLSIARYIRRPQPEEGP